MIPHQLANLTRLQNLDLGFNDLLTNNLGWLSQLRSLRQLDLSSVYLNVTNWLQVITDLPFLEDLRLISCGIGLASPSSLSLPNSSSTSLSVIDLSYNGLTSSTTYYWLFNISKNIVSIDLSSNTLEGPIPDAFGQMASLQDIDLAANLLQGGIPKSFHNLTCLRSLSLSMNNNLSEPLHELLHKLSAAGQKKLEYLDLSMNQFYGPLPNLTRFSSLKALYLGDNRLNGSFLENLVLPPSLEDLDLSGNQITGNMLIRLTNSPSSLEYLDISNNQLSGLPPDLTVFSSLEELHLSNNKIRGSVPASIGQLSQLQKLDVSSNFLDGEITESHFSNLSKLKEIDLSFNSLTLTLNPDWVPSFQLDVIRLANCKMGPSFPQWLKSQRNFSELDLSFSGILDPLPIWFWDLSPRLEYLNLSYNQISGRLPELSQKFDGYPRLDLSSNSFSGPILSVPLNLTSLHLHKNMFIGSISFLCMIKSDIFSSLDLSDNLFSGELPNCWMNMKELAIINVANNNFFGHIPKSLGSIYRVQTLHLSNNSFSGELPSSLRNCRNLKVIDFGGNKLVGNIPAWIGSYLTNLIILSLRSNHFDGNIPHTICRLTHIQILDLSGNNITSNIPPCFFNFTSLVQKNSSANSVTFEFDAYDGSHYHGGDYMDNVLVQWKRQESEYRNILGYLKTIDLSDNNLVGHIPEEIASLKGLISLNLSANLLSGGIIQHIQEMEMLESLDLSRNQLSGEIPAGIVHLHFLGVLDLSYNNLSGRIPSSTQLQSFNATTYIGNRDLCGLPLKNCLRNASDSLPNDYGMHISIQENHKFVTKEFYMSLGFGFIFGFWGVVATLFLNDSWRISYFKFINNLSNRLL